VSELILVRHGETAWNAQRRFQGQTDLPLSARGRMQAQAVANALINLPFSRVYASDLQRALETARTIAAPHGIDVVEDARLREFDFGEWEGRTWTEIVARSPRMRLPTAARLYKPPGGERFKAVLARVRAFLRDLAMQETDRVLVVSHAGPLHAALAALAPAGIERDAVAFSTGSITRLAMDGRRPRIITLNDVSHLDPTA